MPTGRPVGRSMAVSLGTISRLARLQLFWKTRSGRVPGVEAGFARHVWRGDTVEHTAMVAKMFQWP